MSNPAALSSLAYFPEAIQGTPPADAAAWLASGIRIRHLAEALDPSGIKRSSLEDLRSQDTLQGTEQRVVGVDNPEFPFAVYGHGLGVVTADTMQAAAIPLMDLFAHSIGGQRQTFSHTVSGAGSTTTSIDVSDASDWEVGDFVGVAFAAAPAGFPAGTVFPRRILTITPGAPDNITIDQALPAAPADLDIIHATVFAYVDEDVICDSDGAGGPFTRSWLIEKGLATASGSRHEAWEIRGSVSMLDALTAERDQLLQFGFTVMGSSHATPPNAPEPVWVTEPLGFAGLAVGPLTQLWLEDQGTTTNTLVNAFSVNVEPGVPRTRTEVTTSPDQFVEATSDYSSEPAETTITLGLSPFDNTRWDEWESGTFKTLRWTRLGTAGNGFFIHFSRVSYVEEPSRSINGSVSGTEIVLKAHPDPLPSPAPTNTAKWISKIIIGAF